MLSISTCLHPRGQIEQVAHCPAIILRGLCDQAVTIRSLSLNKQKHTHTQTLVHTWLPSCCSSAWSVERRADECSPGTAQQVKKSRRLDVCGGCVSSPPSAGRVGVFNHHTHSLSRSYTAMQLIQPAGKTNRPWPCTPCIGPQSPTTPLKCVICFFHVVMGVESLNEGMNVAPWRSCPLKTQPGSQ